MIANAEKTGQQTPWSNRHNHNYSQSVFGLYPGRGNHHHGHYYGYQHNWYRKVREMMCEPTIALLQQLYIARIVAPGFSIDADEDVPEEITDEVRTCTEEFYDPFARASAFGGLNFGWQSFEIVTDFEDGMLKLQKLKPLIQDNTSIEIYEDTGDFAGVRQGVVTLDEDECALVSFDVEGTDWYGRAPMRNLRIPYEQKLKIETRAEEYDGRVAAAHWVVYYPPGTTPTAWDENNNETEWEDNRAIAEKVLQLLLASGSAVLPAEVKTVLEEMNTNVEGTSLWKVELLAAARTGGTAPYDSRLKYKDVEFARGLGFLERAVFEGQFGTKAEAGEHGESSLVNSEDRATTIAKALTKQVIDNLVETNYGEEWVGKIRVKANPISDKQMTLLLDIYDKLISNQEIALAEYDALDKPQFREVIGLPVDDQAQEVDLLSVSSEDESEDSETDLELSCGANAAGGGGFQTGNTCAKGEGITEELDDRLKEKHGLRSLRINESDDYIEISNIRVNPEDQGQGKGTAAVEDIIREAQSRGVPIVLSSEAFDDGRQEDLDRFYEGLGFRRPGSSKDFSLPRHTHIWEPE